MKYLITSFVSLIALATLFCVAGCNTAKDTASTTTTTYDSAGNKTSVVESSTSTTTKNSPLTDKIVGQVSNITGVIISTSYDSTSSSYSPQIKMATGGSITVTQDKDSDKIVYADTTEAGILNSITNASATSGSTFFIGAKGDKGSGAAKFMTAIAGLKAAKSAVSDTSTVSEIADSAGAVYTRASESDNGTAAYAWSATSGTTITGVYTASDSPAVGDAIYSDRELSAKTGNTVKSVTTE